MSPPSIGQRVVMGSYRGKVVSNPNSLGMVQVKWDAGYTKWVAASHLETPR